MKTESSAFRRRLLKIFGAFFLLGSLVGLIWEIRAAQQEVDALGEILSQEPAVAFLRDGAGREQLEKLLERHRARLGLGRVSLFDAEGNKLAESPGADRRGETGGVHGVLTSVRAGVRDAVTRREVAHLVVWRNMGGGVGRSALLGLLAGLAAAVISLNLPLQGGGEGRAEGS